ncbi:MAG: hypothetical protein GY787_25365 [Alteromonadales bacterium]|nr:hypothetical protein [Alteromonadales bacterium]
MLHSDEYEKIQEVFRSEGLTLPSDSLPKLSDYDEGSAHNFETNFLERVLESNEGLGELMSAELYESDTNAPYKEYVESFLHFSGSKDIPKELTSTFDPQTSIETVKLKFTDQVHTWNLDIADGYLDTDFIHEVIQVINKEITGTLLININPEDHMIPIVCLPPKSYLSISEHFDFIYA